MRDLIGELNRRVAGMAVNRESRAADLLDEALAILRAARDEGLPLERLARDICRAQPSMAPLWNAAVAALASGRHPDRLDRFAARVARSPAALARFARELFETHTAASPLHLVTISSSRSVRMAIDAIRAQHPVRVSASESRPALEGRRLATALAGAGVGVTGYGDAAIAQALRDADAVLVGSDAIGPQAFLNKSGTFMLAAAASQRGVPVYVIATRDKFVPRQIWDLLAIRDEDAAEVWAQPPAGVAVRNVYFEATPLDLVTAVVSDAGVLGGDMVPQLCASLADPVALAALTTLSGAVDEGP